jgi:hypothetical protein
MIYATDPKSQGFPHAEYWDMTYFGGFRMARMKNPGYKGNTFVGRVYPTCISYVYEAANPTEEVVADPDENVGMTDQAAPVVNANADEAAPATTAAAPAAAPDAAATSAAPVAAPNIPTTTPVTTTTSVPAAATTTTPVAGGRTRKHMKGNKGNKGRRVSRRNQRKSRAKRRH